MSLVLKLLEKFFGLFFDKPRSTDIEKARALMKIADLHLASFNKNRDIEWRVNISFWSAIAVIGGFLIEKYPVAMFLHHECVGHYWTLALVGAILVSGMHLGWLCKIQKNQELDKRSYLKCRDEALKCVGSLEAIGRMTEADLSERGTFWTASAAAITFIFFLSISALFLFKIEPAAPIEPVVVSQYDERLFNVRYTEPLKLSPAEAILGSSALES